MLPNAVSLVVLVVAGTISNRLAVPSHANDRCDNVHLLDRRIAIQ